MRLLLLIAWTSLPTALAGCAPEVPPELLGTWTAREISPSGAVWSLTYELGEKRYSVSGDPPTEEGGLFAVDEQDCRRYHLVFTERVANGELAPDINVWVELSRDGARMTWEDHVYRRVGATHDHASPAHGP
ncbi:MAG TPA: hypothetical protein DIU15_12885 [Deltaproteobacteria bacterium]|nr:hypothetical protein [Deltaproteobacteria bacterium]HCP46934.1 hypothetical protein [Deltaproteobacteria bacterium]